LAGLRRSQFQYFPTTNDSQYFDLAIGLTLASDLDIEFRLRNSTIDRNLVREQSQWVGHYAI
jgi:hypothetical protein